MSSDQQRQISTALEAVGKTLDADLRARITTIHESQTALQNQEQDVKKQTAALAKQTNQLSKIAKEHGEGLKEIGDVENWAEMLERDLAVLEETLRLADGGEPSPS